MSMGRIIPFPGAVRPIPAAGQGAVTLGSTDPTQGNLPTGPYKFVGVSPVTAVGLAAAALVTGVAVGRYLWPAR